MTERQLRKPKMYREDLIKDGEHPKGFTAQTANGTAHAVGGGWNKQYDEYERPQCEPEGTRPSGRSNRTGE
jgi:hypothetical protein